MSSSGMPYAGLTTSKGRGKGPKGKREVRLMRMQKQTEHEMANRAKKRAITSARRERLSKANTKLTEQLVKVRDGLL